VDRVLAVPGLDPGISPGHPEWKSGALLMIGITGTRPVMTKEGRDLLTRTGA
jgi:hypothetical protein